ncbi:MAG: hypothetical protein ACOYOK_11630 [Pseudobdellovibrionaceae bacterium]
MKALSKKLISLTLGLGLTIPSLSLAVGGESSGGGQGAKDSSGKVVLRDLKESTSTKCQIGIQNKTFNDIADYTKYGNLVFGYKLKSEITKMEFCFVDKPLNKNLIGDQDGAMSTGEEFDQIAMRFDYEKNGNRKIKVYIYNALWSKASEEEKGYIILHEVMHSFISKFPNFDRIDRLRGFVKALVESFNSKKLITYSTLNQLSTQYDVVYINYSDDEYSGDEYDEPREVPIAKHDVFGNHAQPGDLKYAEAILADPALYEDNEDNEDNGLTKVKEYLCKVFSQKNINPAFVQFVKKTKKLNYWYKIEDYRNRFAPCFKAVLDYHDGDLNLLKNQELFNNLFENMRKTGFDINTAESRGVPFLVSLVFAHNFTENESNQDLFYLLALTFIKDLFEQKKDLISLEGKKIIKKYIMDVYFTNYGRYNRAHYKNPERMVLLALADSYSAPEDGARKFGIESEELRERKKTNGLTPY